MRCEVLAIGTELLLGQIVDTNSAWIGEQLAASGIDSYEHRVIGDNQARIVAALRDLLSRSDAVLVCGGLGPTQDDLTRDAIAEVMGVGLVRQMDLAEHIASMFRTRLRDMPQNNLRQADIPEGGAAIPNPIGTAPGLLCEVGGGKVVYAVPGVPYEMQLMVTEHVVPDLLRRSGEAAAIVSRSLKTWGTSESGLAEMVAHRLDALDNAPEGSPTIAFLARGIEGLVVRITAKAKSSEEAQALVDAEEKELRAILGDLVFGVDDETMEHAVLNRLRAKGWTLGVAESLTGGLIGARIVNVPGASEVFRGAIVSYATDVKRELLDVSADSVVSEEAAREMAEGAERALGADVGIAVTGVAGPTEQDGVAVGTVCFGLALPGVRTEAVSTRLPGDRERLRQFSTISLLNLLRQRLDALDALGGVMEIQVNIDCQDPDALADFYCQALGYSREGGVAQYRSIAAPGMPKLVFQQVSEPRTGKNRVHLDVIVGPDIEGVASKFVALGATRADAYDEFGMHWIVMHDPEGNEICICDA